MSLNNFYNSFVGLNGLSEYVNNSRFMNFYASGGGRAHIVFGIRFSLLIKSNSVYIGQTEDFEEYKTKLFDNKRLNLKMNCFKNITLPSLHNIYKQKDPSIEMVVYLITSHELPSFYKTEIINLSKQYSFLRIKFYSCTDDLNVALTEYMNEYYDNYINEYEMYGSFRIDDDDAVSILWYERLISYLNPMFNNHVISLYSGYQVKIDEHLKILGVSTYEYVLNAQAIGVISQKLIDKPVMNIYLLGSHPTLAQKFPCVIDGSKIFVARILNEANDSRTKLGKDIISINEYQTILTKQFGIFSLGFSAKESIINKNNNPIDNCKVNLIASHEIVSVCVEDNSKDNLYAFYLLDKNGSQYQNNVYKSKYNKNKQCSFTILTNYEYPAFCKIYIKNDMGEIFRKIFKINFSNE